jgi:hypothetical protein
MLSASDYAQRLREGAQQLLDVRAAALQKALADLRDRLSSSLAEVEQRLGSLRGFELPDVDAVLAEAVKEATAAVTRRAGEERERLLGFLAHFSHDVRQKETQEEILNLLLDAASMFAPRVALFVTREERFHGWSCRGYSPDRSRKIGSWSCAKSESRFLQEALQADGLTSLKQRAAEAALSELLGEESQVPWHAFPLRAIRRPVAVLLATPAEGRSCELEALCVLLDLTGLSIENLALKILQEMRQAEKAGAAAIPEREETPVPGQPAGMREEVVEAPAPQEAAPAAGAEPPPAAEEPQVIAPEAAEAAQAAPEVAVSAEAVTPPPEAQEPAAAVEEPVAAVEEPVEAAEPEEVVGESMAAEPAVGPEALVEEAEPQKAPRLREVPLPSEEEKLHSDARRFARLLVSEIKLYNEQQVLEGRANHDLYLRLKRDVDRSREVYEKRVSPEVARKVDYFHDELVRILAADDPAKLGKDYPGPRIWE